jgi:uncharacterized protein YecT (DUF1311 family)
MVHPNFVKPQRMRYVQLASLLSTMLPTLASAVDTPFECKYDGNQQEMNACAVRDYKAADAVLNATYKQVLSALPIAKREELRRERRTWLQERDANCKVAAKLSEGGSIWPLEFFGCLQNVTEMRTKQLERWRAKK